MITHEQVIAYAESTGWVLHQENKDPEGLLGSYKVFKHPESDSEIIIATSENNPEYARFLKGSLYVLQDCEEDIDLYELLTKISSIWLTLDKDNFPPSKINQVLLIKIASDNSASSFNRLMGEWSNSKLQSLKTYLKSFPKETKWVYKLITW